MCQPWVKVGMERFVDDADSEMKKALMFSSQTVPSMLGGNSHFSLKLPFIRNLILFIF